MDRTYRGLPIAFWVLLGGAFINRAGNFVVPFLALYIGYTRGFGEVAAGFVLSVYGAGNFLAGLSGGVLADRIGRRRTMLISLCGGAVSMLALAFARTLPALTVAAFFVGLVNEMYRPVVNAVVADIVPVSERTRAFGHLYWVNNLGFAICSPLAGLAMKTSFVLLFTIDALSTCAFAFVVLLRVPETRPVFDPKTHASQSTAIGVIARDHTFLAIAAMTLAMAAVMWQCGITLPLDMVRKGIPEASYGVLMGINGALIVLVQPFAVERARMSPRTRVLALSALLFGLGFAMHGFVHTRLGFAFAIATWSLAELVLIPTMATVIADLAPPHLRGRYQGVHTMAWGAGSSLAPMVGGAVLAHAGSVPLWLGCGAIMMIVAAGHALVGPARAEREREAAARSVVAVR